MPALTTHCSRSASALSSALFFCFLLFLHFLSSAASSPSLSWNLLHRCFWIQEVLLDSGAQLNDDDVEQQPQQQTSQRSMSSADGTDEL